jgi:cell division septal protein FtsQ
MSWWRKRGSSQRRRRGWRRLFGRNAGRASWSGGQRRLLRACLVLLGLGLAAFGIRRGVRYYLLESGTFTLRKIDIVTGDTLNSQRVLEYLAITNGMPLFALDLARSQQDFLRDAPTIQTLTIRRRLPDAICIRVVERVPLARFARRSLAVDAEGCVFVSYRGIELLPSIAGYEAMEIAPGTRVGGMALAAVELLENLRTANLPLAVVDVDVANEDYLHCTMSDQRRVKLAWQGMGARDARSQRWLLAQLRGLAQAMNSERGRTRSRWDATVPGRAYAQ